MPNDVLVDVVVPAAGAGCRMGADKPKQYLLLDDHTSILEATLKALSACDKIGKIIVALSPEDDFFKKLPCAQDPKIHTAVGGKERCDTVFLALKNVCSTYVMVHDAARPFVALDDLNKLIALCCDDNGGILASPVADTLKFSSDLSVEKTVDRSSLFRAFTPQLFKTSLLIKALEHSFLNHQVVTDEASAMEALGYKPKLVISRADNFKITTPADLDMARAIYQYRKVNLN